MLQNYHKHRKDLARLYRLRDLGNSMELISAEVMSLDPQNHDLRTKLRELRAREEELINSAIEDIPWYCKVITL